MIFFEFSELGVLCVFAGDMAFPTSSSFPNFKYFWLVSYLRNVGQNDGKKIYRSKTPRRKVKNIFRILRTWRLCAFARNTFFRSLLHPKISNIFG